MDDRSCDLRLADATLSEEEEAVDELFATFFSREATPAVARAAEPIGFDKGLWTALRTIGVPMIGVPLAEGGGGAGLIELCLASEHLGRSVAPVPLIETTVATRLLAAVGTSGTRLLDNIASGDTIAVLAPQAASSRHNMQLVPGGSIAQIVIGLDDDELVALTFDEPSPHRANLACAPVAVIDFDRADADREVLIRGAEAEALHAAAVAEWRLLMASALTGIAQTALDAGVLYATERHAFGVPIGAFQAISHPLVDVAISLDSARTLVRRAAWLADNEPGRSLDAIAKSFIHSARAANASVTVSVHTHGGVGITQEADQQMLFRRAKGWACLAGDPTASLDLVACSLAGEC